MDKARQEAAAKRKKDEDARSKKFTLSLYTADGSSVSAKASMCVSGKLGKAGPISLSDSPVSFESSAPYKLQLGIPDVGEITSLTISHDAKDAWTIKQIVLKATESSKVYWFPCGETLPGYGSITLGCDVNWTEDESGTPLITDGLVIDENGKAMNTTPFEKADTSLPEPYALEVDYVKLSMYSGDDLLAHCQEEALELLDNAFIQYQRLMEVDAEVMPLLESAASRAAGEVGEDKRLKTIGEVKAGTASIRLAGQSNYTVRLFTGFQSDAGTEANATIQLCGEQACSAETAIANEGGLAAGGDKSATVTALDLGEVFKIVVGVDGGAKWFLEKAIVTKGSQSWYFPCYQTVSDKICLGAVAAPADPLARDTESAGTPTEQQSMWTTYTIKVTSGKSVAGSCTLLPKGERGDELPIKIDAKAGGAVSTTVASVGLMNICSCTATADGSWSVEDVTITDTATGNIWVFGGAEVTGVAALTTLNEYVYKGPLSKAADKVAAIKLFKASFQSKLVRRMVNAKKAERDKALANILTSASIPSDPAGLAKEVNSITEKFAQIEKNNSKMKTDNADLQKKISQAEEQTQSQKKQLEEELKSMKADLDKALDEAKKAKEAADKANAEMQKKSSVCTIL